jgi:enoyl-CoA hydratase
MVSRVFPTDQLTELTLEFAKRISRLPSMTTLMIKEGVNETQDIQGFTNALKAGFSLHHVMQQHWAELHEDHRATAGAAEGFANWREIPLPGLAPKDKP